MKRWFERERLSTRQPAKNRGGWLVAAVVLAVGLPFLLLNAGGGALVDGPATPYISLADVAVRLAVVLALIYITLLGVRWYMGARTAQAGPEAEIRVVQRFRLGPQQTLYVVAVEDRTLLLGATAASIATLAGLGPAERSAATPEPAALAFERHLRSFVAGAASSKNEGSNLVNGGDDDGK